MAKKEQLDPETLALIEWCTEVEGYLVAAGATRDQAQDFIEDQIEWLTDLYCEGTDAEEAARQALED